MHTINQTPNYFSHMSYDTFHILKCSFKNTVPIFVIELTF